MSLTLHFTYVFTGFEKVGIYCFSFVLLLVFIHLSGWSGFPSMYCKLLLSEFNSILVIPFMSAPSSTLSLSPL